MSDEAAHRSVHEHVQRIRTLTAASGTPEKPHIFAKKRNPGCYKLFVTKVDFCDLFPGVHPEEGNGYAVSNLFVVTAPRHLSKAINFRRNYPTLIFVSNYQLRSQPGTGAFFAPMMAGYK